MNVSGWAVVAAAAVLPGAVFAQVNPNKTARELLSVSEARELVYSSLRSATKRLPGLSLEPSKDAPGDCLTFDVLWANPGPGSVHVDFYTVDLRTGNIWSGPNPPCEKVTSQSLRARQSQFVSDLGSRP